MQHIKAIVNHDCVVLLDSDHVAIVDFLAELQVSEELEYDDFNVGILGKASEYIRGLTI